MRLLLIAVLLLLATGPKAWSQALINGVQPSAVNGVTVASGAAIDGITLTAPGGGGGTPTVVQSQSTGSAGSTAGMVLTSPVTIGNILVAVMYGGSAGSTLTFSDSFTDVATMLASASLATDDDTVAVACTTLSQSGAVTLSFLVNGTGASTLATVYEVSNATCTQDVTAVHTNTLSATSCSSGAMTTSTANDFLVGACGLDGTSTAAVAAGSGWTGLNAGNTGHPLLLGEYRIGTSPGSFTATSGTIPSQEQATLLVALKP
jgi:hypothetical protein